ncbi:glycosyltransferase family 4 protein [Shewanella frigidimarina]|uniref:glycosyltransferase family 4 protein n=1 Tax=Shewanella frigidimarina TaxID=56812 RepID=UPI003FA0C190|tara:strand:- start:1506 stop:2579 length:1074 start_codon:yes stop_codon:yes gene_type:complete
MKKIICFSLGRSGGCLKYAKELLDILAEKESGFESYVNNSCIVDKPNKSTSIPVYSNKITFILSTIFILPIYLLILSFRFLIFRDVKTVYFPYFHYWAVPIIIICRIFCIPTICTVHDGILHSGDGKPFEQVLNNLYIKLATKLIFLTHYVQKLVHKRIQYNVDSLILPHGIIGLDLGMYTNSKYFKKNILFFGRVSKYKGIETLLNAVSLLDANIYEKLIIVGKSQYDVDYSIFPEQSKLVVVDDFVSEENVKDYFDISSILVLPYLEATQSGVAMLGIASNTPMVISRCGGLNEQLTDDEALFFAPDDYLGLSNCITSLLVDEALYQKFYYALGQKSKDESWDVISDKLMRFIES